MNKYASMELSKISEKGMTEELWKAVIEDINKFGELDINNEKDRNTYFYLDHFCDAICKENNYIGDRENIIKQAFDTLKNKGIVSCDEIKEVLYNSIKTSYPNYSLIVKPELTPERDIQKWVRALGEIYDRMANGEAGSEVKIDLMANWDQKEKEDFDAWARYYESGDHEKYAFRKDGLVFPRPPQRQYVFDEDENEEEDADADQPSRRAKKAKTPDEIKKALISRLDAADKLLREFLNVWAPNEWNRLHSTLNDLKREVMLMRSTATMTDLIIRTANIWSKVGFNEGASFLYKTAQLPEGDVTTQIEQALTGKAPEKKRNEEPLNDLPPPADADQMDMSMDPLQPLPEMPDALQDVAPPAEAEEPLPPPADLPPPEPEDEVKNEPPRGEDNPYEGTSVQDVVEILEPLVLSLKERDVARELSKIDMMLDAQKIVSHFPELGEAMSKVLESNNYVSTRLDKMLTKLKGGIQDDDKEDKEEAPEIDLGELQTPPQNDFTQPSPALEVEEPITAPLAPTTNQKLSWRG